jgi:glycerophosphoryl diester phosphodiesterase
MRIRKLLLLSAAATILPVAPAAIAAPPAPLTSAPALEPTLVARARLSADYLAEGPPSGALATPANGRTGPWPGQVIPGFSGALDNHDGSYSALPDNGFGTKENSADYLLRLYRVTPDWRTGVIGVDSFISLRDPDHKIDFPLTRADRLLTGADFDVESIQRVPDGSLWIGEEFGPFLLHFDATGKLLAAPVSLPGGMSPQNPHLAGQPATIPRSRGFEGTAASPDGSTLYPIVEGAFIGETVLRRRYIYEFKTATNSYTGRRWAYQTDMDSNLVGDAQFVGHNRLLLIERDDFDGPASVTKRVYEVDLSKTDADGFVGKTLVLDALRIPNPAGIGAGTGYGTGDPFSFPVQSFETVVPLGKDRLLLANDNNYPGNSARVPGTPDDTEMVIIDLRHRKVVPPVTGPTVIGHRGASGYRPEHTLASYETAILQCADYIEPDLVSTKDGVLVARHENEIGGTTNVADHPEFTSRRTTKTIDGTPVTGWFTEDFTLADLKTLRAKERLPLVRPANTVFDGKYQVPTFDEVLDLARHSRACDGAPVGVYPETKHPTYFDSAGLSLEEPLLAQLNADGFGDRHAPVFIQSFETANLKELNTQTDLPLIQLTDCSGAPYDLRSAGDPRTYADLMTPAGLAGVAQYADGIGACKNALIPRDAAGYLRAPSAVIHDAHKARLIVHAWTFRRENQFLPADFRSSSDPNAVGDLVGEIRAFLDAGLDGFFTDNPDLGVAAVG